MPTLLGEFVYSLKTEPELAAKRAEAVPVFAPAAEEIHWAVNTPLDHCPRWNTENMDNW